MKNKIDSFYENWLEESKAKLLKQFDDEKRANLNMPRMEKQMRKQFQMVYLGYDKLGRSEFYNNVSAKDRAQDINLNPLKLKLNVIYKKD